MAGTTLRGIGDDEEEENREGSGPLPSEQEHAAYSEPTVVDEEKVKEGLRQLRDLLGARRSADPNAARANRDAGPARVPNPLEGAIRPLPGMAGPRSGGAAGRPVNPSQTLYGIPAPPQPGPLPADPMQHVVTPPLGVPPTAPGATPPVGTPSRAIPGAAESGRVVDSGPSATKPSDGSGPAAPTSAAAAPPDLSAPIAAVPEGVPETVAGADATIANPHAAAAAAAAEEAGGRVAQADSAREYVSGSVGEREAASEGDRESDTSRPWYEDVPTADEVYARAQAQKTRWLVWGIIGLGLVAAVVAAVLAGLSGAGDPENRPENRVEDSPPTTPSSPRAPNPDPAAPASEAEMGRPLGAAPGAAAVEPDVPAAPAPTPTGAESPAAASGAGSLGVGAGPEAPDSDEKGAPPPGRASARETTEDGDRTRSRAVDRPRKLGAEAAPTSGARPRPAKATKERRPTLATPPATRSPTAGARVLPPSPPAGQQVLPPSPGPRVPPPAQSSPARAPDDPDSPLPPSLD